MAKGIYYTTGLDTGPLRTGINSARSMISGLVGGMGSLLGPLAAVTAGWISISTVVSQGKRAIGEAMDTETLTAQLKVLLGSSKLAQKALADLTKFSDVTPFEPGPVNEAGRAILAFGFDLKDLLPLLKDSGDLASAMKRPLEEVAGAFGRLRAGQFGEAFEAFRRMGVTIEELKAEGLQFDSSGAFKGSVDAALTAVRSIIQRKFGGTMEEMATTTGGLISTLKGGISALYREFGMPLLDQIRPLLTQAISLVESLQDEARAAGQAVANVIGVLRAAMTAGRLDDLLGAALKAGAAIGVNFLYKALTGVIGSAGVLIGEVMAAFSEKMTDGNWWQGVGNKIEAALLKAAGLFQRAIADSFETAGMGRKAEAMRIRAEGSEFASELAGKRAEAYFDASDSGAPLLARLGGSLEEASKVFLEAFSGQGILDEEKFKAEFATLFNRFRDSADAEAAKRKVAGDKPPQTEPAKPTTPGMTAAGTEGLKTVGDRLAQIGLFVGSIRAGASQAVERNTREIAQWTKQTAQHLAKLQPSVVGTAIYA